MNKLEEAIKNSNYKPHPSEIICMEQNKKFLPWRESGFRQWLKWCWCNKRIYTYSGMFDNLRGN